MDEHPCYAVANEWSSAWLNVFTEQFEEIAADIKGRFSVRYDARIWMTTYGNIHAVSFGVNVERIPKSNWFSMLWSSISCYDVEFVRILPLYSSDDCLTLAVVCKNPIIFASIRSHFQTLAESKGVRLNYLF